LPNELEKLRLEMDRTFDIYTILEGFNYRFTKDELERRWNIFGSPKEIYNLVEKRERELDKKKAGFLDSMKQDQNEFKGQIDNLEMTIRDFHNNQNLKECARYSE
jgi:dynein heavy chain